MPHCPRNYTHARCLSLPPSLPPSLLSHTSCAEPAASLAACSLACRALLRAALCAAISVSASSHRCFHIDACVCVCACVRACVCVCVCVYVYVCVCVCVSVSKSSHRCFHIDACPARSRRPCRSRRVTHASRKSLLVARRATFGHSDHGGGWSRWTRLVTRWSSPVPAGYGGSRSWLLVLEGIGVSRRRIKAHYGASRRIASARISCGNERNAPAAPTQSAPSCTAQVAESAV
jgi:hypothetical protein